MSTRTRGHEKKARDPAVVAVDDGAMAAEWTGCCPHLIDSMVLVRFF